MLRHTFRHLPGIGPALEQRLWARGIADWDAALAAARDERPLRPHAEALARDRERLAAADAAHFGRVLRARDQWRLYGEPAFRRRVVFVDIETTGAARGSAITAVALADAAEVRWYEAEQNLGDFARDIRGYDLLVTFNGKRFDAPVLRERFGPCLPPVHIDLMNLLHRLGYRGGLKACEEAMGLDRGPLEGMDGSDAVRLYRMWAEHADAEARRRLLAYNIADVLSLQVLLARAYNRMIEQTPFEAALRVDEPTPPGNPFV